MCKMISWEKGAWELLWQLLVSPKSVKIKRFLDEYSEIRDSFSYQVDE